MIKRVPPMKRSARAKSIMVDNIDSNLRRPKMSTLTRSLRGVRK